MSLPRDSALTLDIEIFSQVHYRASIEPDTDLSDLWKDVFLFHMREESQHAILDELEWVRENAKLTPEARDAAVDDVIALVALAAIDLDHQLLPDSLTLPLLIGGATTSRQHTAVKIAPEFSGPTVHVLDASRAVGVAGSLLSTELRSGYVAEVASDYEKIRAQHAAKKGPVLIPLEAARANAFRFDWAHYAPPQPALPGVPTAPGSDFSTSRSPGRPRR